MQLESISCETSPLRNKAHKKPKPFLLASVFLWFQNIGKDQTNFMSPHSELPLSIAFSKVKPASKSFKSAISMGEWE